MGAAQRHLGARVAPLWLALLGACGGVEHVDADQTLQLDAELPAHAEQVVVCVKDGVERSFGPGDGRYAVTGLPAELGAVVTLDLFGDTGAPVGRVGPVVLDAAWVESTLDTEPCGEEDTATPCDRPCRGTGGPPAAGEESWVLGVRFSEL